MSMTPPVVRRITLLGPAFVAAVAYVDPGNVATNVTAGARFGYTLVWVVVLANAMAVLVQYLSAKLGMVTGGSLATHVGRRLSRGPRLAYWLQAEAVAIATDLAEVVGGAIALNLLFDLPLLVGAVITATISILILRIGDVRGQSTLERVIVMFLMLIAVGFLAGLFVNPPEPGALASGLVPRFDGSDSVLLASGIIGATVMPHVIYLHSSLTVTRLGDRGKNVSVRDLLSATRADVVLALLLAGLLNLSLLVVAAAGLQGLPGTDTLNGAHAVVSSELGAGVALLFAVSLLGVRPRVDVGRQCRRCRGDARAARSPHPDDHPPDHHRDPGPRRARARRRAEWRAGGLSGTAVARHPVRADPARPADVVQRGDGGARQSARAHRGGVGGGDDRRLAQPRAARPDVHLTADLLG